MTVTNRPRHEKKRKYLVCTNSHLNIWMQHCFQKLHKKFFRKNLLRTGRH
uniref:Uncharacterized protein n=1 Tax=Rhizophora mucronata TaxID=61149 RepID=A0A2P2QRA6_RHIMU